MGFSDDIVPAKLRLSSTNLSELTLILWKYPVGGETFGVQH